MAHIRLLDAPSPPGLETIDAREGTRLAQPQALLDAVRSWCAARPRSFVLFDPLEAMSERWGDRTARRFFQRACPLLLELGAIAYWPVASGRRTRELGRGEAMIAGTSSVTGWRNVGDGPALAFWTLRDEARA